MLALQPGAVDWTVAEIEINDGVTTDQFNGSTQRMDVVAVLDELVAWATSTFIGTFSWSWTRDAATGGAVITLATSSGAFTLEATNADAQAGYGLSAGVHASAASHEFDTVAAGTWAPLYPIGVRANIRVLDRGDACGNGATRPGVPGFAANAPAVTAAGTAIDAGRLTEQMASASSPRRARVYQLHTATWVELAIGAAQRSPLGLLHYRFTLDAAGDAI
jgi:hypothetical protein